MHPLLTQLFIICPLVFMAGFIDAIAGGGGIISIPAYLFAGLPIHNALGTNKMAMCFGTSVATANYIRSGKIYFKIALVAALGSFLGAAIGSSLALFISEIILKITIMTLLPLVAVFLATQKGFGRHSHTKILTPVMQFLLSFFIGFFIGIYDGLIGPGTGTFFILAFTGFLGFDLITSSGCAKISNLASNLASMLIYTFSGKVLFAIALPSAACAMLGGHLGAQLAIKGGTKWIRLFIFLVLILLFIKTAYEFFI
ncbi:hypothetical protein CS063_09330 [Sporanaerobium hydrogeniformans]|uniref:Uncharacterized protein n=1 Tax=Sporanaerobium hydrogeniformans TaxID=3072179 RepID=A0AC61DBR5_9FIRM|nr:TSUP family transporter [Sporanaerobium hydrogeniformans]PHV70719.1 hypothetical protein CS063_09330 [Sporanaerobium hydrogeniformans]